MFFFFFFIFIIYFFSFLVSFFLFFFFFFVFYFFLIFFYIFFFFFCFFFFFFYFFFFFFFFFFNIDLHLVWPLCALHDRGGVFVEPDSGGDRHQSPQCKLAMRERFLLNSGQESQGSSALVRSDAIDEVIVLSNCSRTEFSRWTQNAFSNGQLGASLLTRSSNLKLWSGRTSTSGGRCCRGPRSSRCLGNGIPPSSANRMRGTLFSAPGSRRRERVRQDAFSTR